MRFGQIHHNGAVCAAIFENGETRPIPGVSALALLLNPALAGNAGAPAANARLTLPIHPPEVWGCGCTYETSASFRDAEHGTREGMYAYVYREARPEVFFKGTARVCTGPGEPIGIRCDSHFTAPEPELALVLGEGGRIAGFTLANDVSAWDIERENALYLTQSKVYDRCCALGPVIVTPDEIGDVRALEMTCRITRSGVERFSGSVSISRLHRKLETLVEYLTRANRVPAGTVLLTGTGIIVTKESALAPGDVVSISVPGIGELSNPAEVVG
jgi:2-dehydro-3-deoxy-D-arabinonate dehydratase